MGWIGPEGLLEEGSLSWKILGLNSATPEDFLEDRLIPFRDDEVLEALKPLEVLYGQKNLPGIKPALTLICELDAEKISIHSPFWDLYYPQGKLFFWSLNWEECELKEGMFLIAIRVRKAEDEFNWNIGWVTEEEIASLFPET